MERTGNDWRDSAECKKADPELFFPIGESSAVDRDQIQAAKKFCADCLVRGQCLEYAQMTHQDFGIWGGETENERRARRRRAAAIRRRPDVIFFPDGQ